jgi:hypothetical protein
MRETEKVSLSVSSGSGAGRLRELEGAVAAASLWSSKSSGSLSVMS